MLLFFPVHTTAVVTHCQHYKVARNIPKVIGAVSLIKDHILGFNAEPANVGNGVSSVDAQVGKDLVELGGIHFDRPQIRIGKPGQIDVFTNKPTQHLEHSLHRNVQIQYPRERLSAGGQMPAIVG